jgi:hypothetical protein
MPEGTHGGNGRFIRTVKSVQRDADAAALRAQGWTFQRIANELGYANKGKARDGVLRAFAEIPYEDLEAARRLDLERIDRLIEQAWQVMERGHVAYSNGQVVRRRTGETEMDDDGFPVLDKAGKPVPVYEEVQDDGPVLAAIDRIRALLERRAKITGYEAPSRSRIEVITADVIESEIARLEGELAANDRDAADTGTA